MAMISNTRRFFVPPEALAADEVELADQALAHQIGRVLRLGPGERVLLLDGLGVACAVELTVVERERVAGQVVGRGPAGGEPPVTLTLYLALIRPERFEWALQKAVELGVRRVVPVRFARSLPADRADARKLERWAKIVREAAEQSCRGVLPAVAEPLPLELACAEAASADLALLLWEGEAPHIAATLRARLPARSIALISGPEGGIAPEELTAAGERGIIPVSLGPRTLRAETAPVAAAAAIMYALEG
jgi:16S rRNA (uracil1498-N3)-methyltransferase